MRIEQAFEISQPPQAVWELFQDVPAISPCLPGAELGEARDNDTYAGRLTVKLGPITGKFDGEATVTADPRNLTAEIKGSGLDRRGGSRGQVAMRYVLSPVEGGTRVAIEADVTLAGPIAQFGRTGLVNEMAKRLMGQFAACLEAKLGATSADEAAAVKAGDVKAVPLLAKSLWTLGKERLGRD